MFAIDNGNPGTAELILAIALILAIVGAVFYLLSLPFVRLAPVAVALAVGAIALAWWVL